MTVPGITGDTGAVGPTAPVDPLGLAGGAPGWTGSTAPLIVPAPPAGGAAGTFGVTGVGPCPPEGDDGVTEGAVMAGLLERDPAGSSSVPSEQPTAKTKVAQSAPPTRDEVRFADMRSRTVSVTRGSTRHVCCDQCAYAARAEEVRATFSFPSVLDTLRAGQSPHQIVRGAHALKRPGLVAGRTLFTTVALTRVTEGHAIIDDLDEVQKRTMTEGE